MESGVARKRVRMECGVVRGREGDKGEGSISKQGKIFRPSSLWMRKWFHLLALLVYLPGVALDPPFLALTSAVVSFLFLVAEVGGASWHLHGLYGC